MKKLVNSTATADVGYEIRASREEVRRFYRTVGLVEQPEDASGGEGIDLDVAAIP